jgi:hypothetical protein
MKPAVLPASSTLRASDSESSGLMTRPTGTHLSLLSTDSSAQGSRSRRGEPLGLSRPQSESLPQGPVRMPFVPPIVPACCSEREVPGVSA